MKKIEPAPNFKDLVPDNITDIIFNEEIGKLLHKINEEYYYWDKVKYQPIPDNINIDDVWRLVKIRRRSSNNTIQFGKYKFYWNLNNRLHEYLHFLDLNIGGTLESSSIISKTDKNRYLLSSIMEEAIASSKLEGAVTTRKHAKDMLRKSIKPRNVSEQMIYNNYITIQKIIEIKSDKLNMETLLDVHRLVTTNTLSSYKEEGFIRDNDDIKVIDTSDGTVVHTPPFTSELEVLLKDLFNFFNDDDDKFFIHPIIKATIIHFMIGFIHPFADGNGSTGRALFYWYLLKKQYWLTEYLSISRLILRSKGQYARAFIYTEIDDLDLTYFISYNLRTMKLAFEELRIYIKRKNEEKMQLSSFLGIDGLNYRQALILEWFTHEKELLLTVKEVEKRLGISNVSARTDLNELVEKKYLLIRSINKVTRGYVKGEKFELLLNREKYRIKTAKSNLQQQELFNKD